MNLSKILIVDDEEQFTNLVRINLEKTSKFIVRVVNEPSLAINEILDFEPDLVLLDIMMPEVDGNEIARIIQKNETLKNTKFVFLTAIITKQEVNPTGGEIGGHTFIPKPVKIDDLIFCIENELKKA